MQNEEMTISLEEIERQYAEVYETLPFTDDFIFCKVLVDNPDICIELIELILHRKVKRIVQLENQKSIKETPDGKGVRLDVLFEDDENTVYNIEMQTTKPDNLPKRTRYYQGMIDLNILNKGEDYNKLKQSFIVFICAFDAFDRGRHLYTFRKACVEEPGLTLNDGAEVVFLCAGGDQDDVSERVKNFLNYVSRRAVSDSFTKKIESAVDIVRNNPERRAEFMTLMLRDIKNREEGRAEGQNLLVSVIQRLKNGESADDIRQSGVDENTVALALTCQ